MVTLSDQARAACRRLDIIEPALKRARQRATSTTPLPDALLVYAELEDGRCVQMRCRHDEPGQILSVTVT